MIDYKEIYVNRLYTEWIIHGQIIIALDYDDTISPWKVDTPELFQMVLSLVRKCQKEGSALVAINTCSDPQRREEIFKYCEENGIKVSTINENAIPHLIYGNHGKMFANIYLDDRGGLLQSMEILEEALTRYVTHKKQI